MNDYYYFACKMNAKITDFSYTSRVKCANGDKFRNGLNS